ncbi:hypothetical protein CHARACLAT_003115 [Characodon lateralis]|uniref:Uncharacterized protein n=1 Tax=Characodon lateralis TaxID=208331 RepID=A0ABU7CKK2_9TELE|nr:hypothetical protein [Characodon lateralis]
MFKIPTDKEHLDSKEPNTKENKKRLIKDPMPFKGIKKSRGIGWISDESLSFPSVGGDEVRSAQTVCGVSVPALSSTFGICFCFEELILALWQAARLRSVRGRFFMAEAIFLPTGFLHIFHGKIVHFSKSERPVLYVYFEI